MNRFQFEASIDELVFFVQNKENRQIQCLENCYTLTTSYVVPSFSLSLSLSLSHTHAHTHKHKEPLSLSLSHSLFFLFGLKTYVLHSLSSLYCRMQLISLSLSHSLSLSRSLSRSLSLSLSLSLTQMKGVVSQQRMRKGHLGIFRNIQINLTMIAFMISDYRLRRQLLKILEIAEPTSSFQDADQISGGKSSLQRSRFWLARPRGTSRQNQLFLGTGSFFALKLETA